MLPRYRWLIVGYICKPPISLIMKVSTLKVTLSIVLIVAGIFAGVTLTHGYSSDSRSVMTLDFGDYDIFSTDIEAGNAAEALVNTCAAQGFSITYDSAGNVETIDGKPGFGDDRVWGLYVMDGMAFVPYSGAPSDLKISEGTVISWGLCEAGQVPTTVVDATGNPYTGFGIAKRIVSLAPSITETICALGGEDRIIGTDMYSNYPASIQAKREAGIIAETGSFTGPNYETIIQLEPDLVFGIASQYSHKVMVERLRAVGINAVLVTDGESLPDVYDNTYMTGAAMGIPDKGAEVANKLKSQVEQTYTYISSVLNWPTTMVALSSDKAPWIAGADTYINDVLGKSGAANVYSDVYGWKQVNPETIVQGNPTVIIVLSSFPATQTYYDLLLADMEEEWKSTDAYKNGDIYVISGSASDMLQRPSTRLGQLSEVLGRMLHEESFPDVIHIPKFFGDNYTDYLTYSKEL